MGDLLLINYTSGIASADDSGGLAVVLQREIIGIEQAEGLHRVGAVLGDVAGIERSGQHDGKV